MTQKKADADPWLTDMVTRDREVAKTVVYGFRTIISLLRSIRDEQAEESKYLRMELSSTRQEVRDLWAHVARSDGASNAERGADYPHCEAPQCGLPLGHLGNHRGSLRSA